MSTPCLWIQLTWCHFLFKAKLSFLTTPKKLRPENPKNFIQLFDWANRLLLRFECLACILFVGSSVLDEGKKCFNRTKKSFALTSSQSVRRLLGANEIHDKLKKVKISMDSLFTGVACPYQATAQLSAACRRRKLGHVFERSCFIHVCLGVFSVGRSLSFWFGVFANKSNPTTWSQGMVLILIGFLAEDVISRTHLGSCLAQTKPRMCCVDAGGCQVVFVCLFTKGSCLQTFRSSVSSPMSLTLQRIRTSHFPRWSWSLGYILILFGWGGGHMWIFVFCGMGLFPWAPHNRDPRLQRRAVRPMTNSVPELQRLMQTEMKPALKVHHVCYSLCS